MLWTCDADGATKIRTSDDSSCEIEAETVPALLKRIVREFPAHTAIATKDNDGDEWKTWTFTEYYQDCRKAGKSFIKVRYLHICDKSQQKVPYVYF